MESGWTQRPQGRVRRRLRGPCGRCPVPVAGPQDPGRPTWPCHGGVREPPPRRGSLLTAPPGHSATTDRQTWTVGKRYAQPMVPRQDSRRNLCGIQDPACTATGQGPPRWPDGSACRRQQGPVRRGPEAGAVPVQPSGARPCPPPDTEGQGRPKPRRGVGPLHVRLRCAQRDGYAGVAAHGAIAPCRHGRERARWGSGTHRRRRCPAAPGSGAHGRRPCPHGPSRPPSGMQIRRSWA